MQDAVAGLPGPVDVGSGCHSHHGHDAGAVVDSVEDAVGPPACAKAIVERGHESLADAVWVGQRGPLMNSCAANATPSGSCSASCRRAVAVISNR